MDHENSLVFPDDVEIRPTCMEFIKCLLTDRFILRYLLSAKLNLVLQKILGPDFSFFTIVLFQVAKAGPERCGGN